MWTGFLEALCGVWKWRLGIEMGESNFRKTVGIVPWGLFTYPAFPLTLFIPA